MREQIRDIDRLRHIVECIDCINEYLSGYTYEQMKADKKCFHAVVYNLMIIGETANLLTKEFRNEQPDHPWVHYYECHLCLGYLYQRLTDTEATNSRLH